MKELSDMELVMLARHGHEEAKEELFDRCKDVISYHVGRYKRMSFSRLYSQDVEDMKSESYIAVMKAIDLYDETRGASFAHFCKFLIRKYILDHLENKVAEEKNVIQSTKLELISAPQSKLSDLTIKVKNDKERTVIKLLLDEGLTKAEISRKMGMTKRGIDLIIKRCIK